MIQLQLKNATYVKYYTKVKMWVKIWTAVRWLIHPNYFICIVNALYIRTLKHGQYCSESSSNNLMWTIGRCRSCRVAAARSQWRSCRTLGPPENSLLSSTTTLTPCPTRTVTAWSSRGSSSPLTSSRSRWVQWCVRWDIWYQTWTSWSGR